MVEMTARRLVVMAGDRACAIERLSAGLSGADLAETLWVANQTAPDGVVHATAARVQRQLGRDYRLVVFDAHQGFHPDAFAAAVGTLRGGGDCVLLTPPLHAWPDFVDPDRARFAAYPLTPERLRGHFVRRLLALWRGDAAVCEVEPADGFVPRLAAAARADLRLSDGQLAAIDAVRRVALGHARRPLVMTADRGRGKSTVLGIAAARLLADGYPRITVVAPGRGAVETLFHHARAAAEIPGQGVSDLDIGAGRLCFRTPAECLAEDANPGLIMVDEAAALSVAVLDRLLRKGNRLVFASTVHGYEGSGRGFALRFAELLRRAMPKWRAVALDQPVRWAVDDPLERLVNQALLLDVDGDQPPTAGDWRVGRLDVGELVADESLLRSVFGLLVSAHYQTRPSDLRQLLDDPRLVIWVARQAGQVGGVLLAQREGGLDEAMRDAVVHGRRRPRGHLLVQSLAVHAGLDEVLAQRVWRIQRIAVHAACRRAGLGRRLIDGLAAEARAQGDDLLGCAFGIDRPLLAFWRALGFRPQRVGLRVDPASAARSLFMLRGLSPAGLAVAEQGWRRFVAQLPWALGASLRDLPTASAITLLDGRDCADLACDQATRRVLWRVASGARQAATAEAALWRMAVRTAATAPQAPGLDAVFARYVQHHSTAQVCRCFGLSGRAELERALRALLLTQLPASGDG